MNKKEKKKPCSECMNYKEMWLRAEEHLHDPALYRTQLLNALDERQKELDKLREGYTWVCERLTQLERSHETS